jgi:predicted DsbA family dithiol-disulfide isomerase
MHPIHVEIWSDFVCPFCYIGKRNLEKALASFPERERVKITFKSFELDPREDRDKTRTVYERLAEKYEMSLDDAKKATAQVAAAAQQAGLTFNFDRVIPANTFHAHRLGQLALREGLGDPFTDRLMAAHFTDGKDIGDLDVLEELGKEVGLNPLETHRVLSGEDYAGDVRRDEQEAWQSGIRAVPFFLFNNEVAVRGAHGPDAFLTALYSAPPLPAGSEG